MPDSQGAAAGLLPGDVLIAYGDTPLDSTDQLIALTGETPQDPDGVIPGQVHLDEAFDTARLAAMLEQRADYPVLHIASHFSLNPGNNLDSYLLLGDGTRLTLADIDSDPDYALFGIDLLSLSACDTAVGQQAAGAEIESFGALAQLRGARGVLASLWAVNCIWLPRCGDRSKIASSPGWWNIGAVSRALAHAARLRRRVS